MKNEDYWNADQVKLDKLVMNLVQEPTVAAQNFDSGSNDFAPIDSDLVDQYKDDDAFITFKEGYLFYLQPNFQNTDLQNLNLRKALSLAIDREDFATNVLKDGSIEPTDLYRKIYQSVQMVRISVTMPKTSQLMIRSSTGRFWIRLYRN